MLIAIPNLSNKYNIVLGPKTMFTMSFSLKNVSQSLLQFEAFIK